MSIKETAIKIIKNIAIKLEYRSTDRIWLSLINFSDLIIKSPKGINGIMIILKGTIALMNAP